MLNIYSCCIVIVILFLCHNGMSVNATLCEEFTLNKSPLTQVKCDRGCFALWKNVSGNITVRHKGCWTKGDEQIPDKCQGMSQSSNLIFCECGTDFCNRNLSWDGRKRASTITNISSTVGQPSKSNDHIIYVVLAVVVLAILAFLFFIIFLKRRVLRKPETENISKASEIETLMTPDFADLPPIDLKEVLSQGQFCTVRKGRMGYKDVAVKIFPFAQFSKPTPSALTEEDIYVVCKLNHENILKFVGRRVHEEANQQELWLVTEYIEQGSLSDFLKRNTINWENLFHMAHGLALGMAYLHSEIPKVKPSIAHRDIKSKNILVKNNLTCCISDFGLSMKFDNKDGPGDTHGQVGTRRYMAPEVLEGAINFSREAFLRIDMYAFALCLWELLTRCTAVQGERTPEYKLPFEEEVGIHPTLEELQDYVVNKKLRPSISYEMKNKDQAIDGMLVTIEECWDHDADARLTADCVAERIKQYFENGKRQANTIYTGMHIQLEKENELLA